jgi:hypothetical protein
LVVDQILANTVVRQSNEYRLRFLTPGWTFNADGLSRAIPAQTIRYPATPLHAILPDTDVFRVLGQLHRRVSYALVK